MIIVLFKDNFIKNIYNQIIYNIYRMSIILNLNLFYKINNRNNRNVDYMFNKK